jgi:hypothetical protein
MVASHSCCRIHNTEIARRVRAPNYWLPHTHTYVYTCSRADGRRQKALEKQSLLGDKFQEPIGEAAQTCQVSQSLYCRALHATP